MTNLSEKLEQLSAAAMEAERIYGQGLNPGAPFGNWLRAQAAFSTALVNAFRTGQLVAVQADDAIAYKCPNCEWPIDRGTISMCGGCDRTVIPTPAALAAKGDA